MPINVYNYKEANKPAGQFIAMVVLKNDNLKGKHNLQNFLAWKNWDFITKFPIMAYGADRFTVLQDIMGKINKEAYHKIEIHVIEVSHPDHTIEKLYGLKTPPSFFTIQSFFDYYVLRSNAFPFVTEGEPVVLPEEVLLELAGSQKEKFLEEKYSFGCKGKEMPKSDCDVAFSTISKPGFWNVEKKPTAPTAEQMSDVDAFSFKDR